MTRNKDGFLEGNGIIILILFFLMFGNGGFGGFGNNAGLQGALTRAELYEGLNTKGIEDSIRGIQQGLCDGFYAMNTSMLNGFNGIQRDLCAGFSGINANLNQLGYNMKDCCCEIKQAIHADGEATRALFQADVIQKLRDELAQKDRDLLVSNLFTAQQTQTANLKEFIRQMVNGCSC
jgi:hypothetical protein